MRSICGEGWQQSVLVSAAVYCAWTRRYMRRDLDDHFFFSFFLVSSPSFWKVLTPSSALRVCVLVVYFASVVSIERRPCYSFVSVYIY